MHHQSECTVYEVSNMDLSSNTVISRADRIDYLPGGPIGVEKNDTCTDLSSIFPVLGTEFCLGDTFATGGIPFYAEGSIDPSTGSATEGAQPLGFLVSKGSRVPPISSLTPDPYPLSVITFRDETLYFFDEGTVDYSEIPVNQLTYSGLLNFNRPGAYYYGITAGTGDHVGAQGQVKVTNFFAAPAPITIEVCQLSDD